MAKKKKKPSSPAAPIMRKAKVHKTEDAKLYDRKRTKDEERKADESGS
jgi:hypothetical protein